MINEKTHCSTVKFPVTLIVNYGRHSVLARFLLFLVDKQGYFVQTQLYVCINSTTFVQLSPSIYYCNKVRLRQVLAKQICSLGLGTMGNRQRIFSECELKYFQKFSPCVRFALGSFRLAKCFKKNRTSFGLLVSMNGFSVGTYPAFVP